MKSTARQLIQEAMSQRPALTDEELHGRKAKAMTGALMNIRKATKADLKTCLEIQTPETENKKVLFKYNFLKELEDEYFHILVAEIKDEVIGFIVFRRDDWNNLFFIEQLFVKYKNKGYGSKILSHVKALGKKNKMRLLMLDTQSVNKDAMRFYKRNGFVRAGHINGMYNDPKIPNAVIMTYKI